MVPSALRWNITPLSTLCRWRRAASASFVLIRDSLLLFGLGLRLAALVGPPSSRKDVSDGEGDVGGDTDARLDGGLCVKGFVRSCGSLAALRGKALRSAELPESESFMSSDDAAGLSSDVSRLSARTSAAVFSGAASGVYTSRGGTDVRPPRELVAGVGAEAAKPGGLVAERGTWKEAAWEDADGGGDTLGTGDSDGCIDIDG